MATRADQAAFMRWLETVELEAPTAGRPIASGRQIKPRGADTELTSGLESVILDTLLKDLGATRLAAVREHIFSRADGIVECVKGFLEHADLKRIAARLGYERGDDAFRVGLSQVIWAQIQPGFPEQLGSAAKYCAGRIASRIHEALCDGVDVRRVDWGLSPSKPGK